MRRDIFDAIVNSLFEGEKDDKMWYLRLYNSCIKEMKYKISHRDFSNTLNEMVEENLVNKNEEKDSRLKLKPVCYSPTQKAIKRRDLNILSKDEVAQRYSLIYQLLFCFGEFKQPELLTEKQFDGFLKKIHCSRNDLKVQKISKAGIFFEHLKRVQIVKWTEDNSKLGIKAGSYSVSVPGFSVKEFIFTMKRLKKGKGLIPRLFSSYPFITDVPFVSYFAFREEEVNDAVNRLGNEDIIRAIDSVFPKEMRYDIVDKSLKDFAKDVWLAHDYDFRLLIERIVFTHIPTKEDKDYLNSFYGKKYADKILADLHHKKRIESEEKKIAEQFIEDFDNNRKSLIQDIIKKYNKTIKEYEIASELAERILHPSSTRQLKQSLEQDRCITPFQ